MVVESKKGLLQKALLSSDNRLCIVANDRYLIIDLNKMFSNNERSLKWQDFSLGVPSQKILGDFSEIPFVKDTSYETYLSLKNNSHISQKNSRNVLYLYREFNKSRSAWLEFEVFPTEQKFDENKQRFLIEEPVHFERVYKPFIDG